MWVPKGVIETGRNTIKYQARVSYKPDGSKTVQRNAGTFNTPEEAALQIAAYETKLAEGMDPWDGAEIRSQHKRGQVWRSILVLHCSRIPVCLNHRAPHLQAPPMRTERRRKVGKKGSLSGSEGREHGSDGDLRMRPQAKLQGRITRSCPHASETLAARPCPRGCCRMLGHGLHCSPWTARAS